MAEYPQNYVPNDFIASEPNTLAIVGNILIQVIKLDPLTISGYLIHINCSIIMNRRNDMKIRENMQATCSLWTICGLAVFKMFLVLWPFWKVDKSYSIPFQKKYVYIPQNLSFKCDGGHGSPCILHCLPRFLIWVLNPQWRIGRPEYLV